ATDGVEDDKRMNKGGKKGGIMREKGTNERACKKTRELDQKNLYEDLATRYNNDENIIDELTTRK
ncbi:2899_t:CDS:1, partial [Ambispora leptoticha]